MSNKNIAIGATVIVVVIALLYWIEREKSKRLEEELNNENDYSKKLEIDNLKLIQTVLNQDSQVPKEIKEQLQELFVRYELKNLKIAKEITSIIKLIEGNQYEKAVMSIAKVIENLLKLKLTNHSELKKIAVKKDGNTRKPVFADYIKCAFNTNLFDEDDFQYAELLRKNRNKEAHEVGNENIKNYNLSSILTGITLIAKCENVEIA